MRKHLRHLGSTLAIVLGLLMFAAGITQRGSLLISGPVVLLGAFIGLPRSAGWERCLTLSSGSRSSWWRWHYS
jgi:hypothetical protein